MYTKPPDQAPVRLHLILLLHAFALAGFILVRYFLPVSFALAEMKNLVISQATANGVDVGLRVQTVYRFLVLGAGIAVVFYLLFRFLQGRGHLSFQYHDELLFFSAAILGMSFLQVMRINCLTVLEILAGLFWLRVGMLLRKSWSQRTGRMLQHKTVFGLSLVFAFFLLFAVFFLWGDEEWVAGNTALIYLGLVLLLTALQILFYVRFHRSMDRVLLSLLPLSSIPFLAFFSVESAFYSRQQTGHMQEYELVFAGLFAGLLSVYQLWYWLLGRKLLYSRKSLLRNWLGPAFLFGYIVLAYYTPVLPSQQEMFEAANPANAMLNMFRFGEWPMLDFMSSHLFSEQWYGLLYEAVFGFNGQQDFLVYWFFNILLFYLVVYWFLNRLFRRPLLSLFLITCLPFLFELFFPYVFMGVLPFFYSRRLLERPSVRVFLELFLLLALMLLWRMDMGAAGLVAAGIYFPLLWFLAGKRFPLRQFIKGLALFMLVVLFVVLGAAWLRSPELIRNNLQVALHYFAGSQAHGYKQIENNFAQQFYVYHVLFPFAAVVACAYIILALRKRTFADLLPQGYLLLASLFLFLLFLANLQRAVVRHGFAEHGEIILCSTFFVALALLVVHWSKAIRPLRRFTVLYAAILVLFILLKFFPFRQQPVTAETVLTANFFQDREIPRHWDQYSGRVKSDTAWERLEYGALRQFLDQYLAPEQTFLDLSNTPMLYFYCGREVPGYFNQNLQNSIDDYLQLALLDAVDTQRVPVVVFANYPRVWSDATDDVPNTQRYYLLAEYVFRNYRPYGIIGNKSIWVAHHFRMLPEPALRDPLLEQVEQADLNLVPEYTGLFYDQAKNKKDLERVGTWSLTNAMLQGDTLVLALKPELLALGHCYLDIKMKSRPEVFEPIRMQVDFLDTGKSTAASFSFLRRDKVSVHYLLRLSNHYFWHRHDKLELRILPATEVAEVAVWKDTRMSD